MSASIDRSPDNGERSNLILISGAARSGKSLLAERIALESARPVYYLATMQHWPGDGEVTDRIARHRQRRPDNWTTLESPLALDATVAALPAGPAQVIVDCLSLYVSNLILEDYVEGQDPYASESVVLDAAARLLKTIADRADLDFVVVTNEVGWGVVPDTPLGRAYRDLLGLANQMFAAAAVRVYLVCLGQKLRLK